MRDFTHMRRFAHFRSNCRRLPKTFRGSGAWNGQPHTMPDLGWTDNRNVGVGQSVRDAGGAVSFWECRATSSRFRGASEGIGITAKTIGGNAHLLARLTQSIPTGVAADMFSR